MPGLDCFNIKPLIAFLCSESDHGPHLSYEEMTTVRRNLATNGVEADNELVRFDFLLDLTRHGGC